MVVHCLPVHDPLAQWIEHRFPKPGVAGSSPARVAGWHCACTQAVQYRVPTITGVDTGWWYEGFGVPMVCGVGSIPITVPASIVCYM